MGTERNNWKREELLVALKIYCELTFGQFNKGNKRIMEVASYLHRTPSALSMKLCNFYSLDPAKKSTGLSTVSKADKAIMAEFLNNTEEVILESERAYQLILGTDLSDQSTAIDEITDTTETEQVAEVKIRTIQHFFRRAVLSSYHSKCAVCELGVPELLIASHIVPWSKDKTCRADPTNGISLCALHDRAFDRGLFSINDDYTLILSPCIQQIKKPTPSIDFMFTQFEKQAIKLPERFHPNRKFIGWHREHVFQST